MEGNLVKSWVIPLSWDFLVSTLTHPSKELHISTLFGAPVNVLGDNFGSVLARLGFRRRGGSRASEWHQKVGESIACVHKCD